MKNVDKTGGIFFMTFGLFFTVYGAATLPLGTFRHPNSGLFPFLVSLGLAGLSLWLALKGEKEKPRTALQFGKEWKKVIYCSVGLIMYVIFFNKGGFIFCTILFLICFLKWIEGRGWITSLIFSTLSVGSSYILFSRFLGVPLPQGIIPI